MLRQGREAHAELFDKARAKGWQVEPRLQLPDGKYVKPDVVTSRGRFMDLKPRTPSGIRAGVQAMQKYQQVVKKGRIIYYDPKR